MKRSLIGIILISISNLALSWDGSKSGTISVIEVTSGNNYGFRVWLNGSPALCGNSNKWAYINESDSNYSVYVSSLLAAKAAQQKVTLYTNRRNGEENGFCKIGHIQIN